MPIIHRQIEEEARLLASQFRALAIVGPRQSGKTTLSKLLFPQKPYVSLENPRIQMEAEADPEAFLRKFPQGAILDEIQRLPILFRYLQTLLDSTKEAGKFILIGSNNFLLQEQISQSLAGRLGYLQLLPLSYRELQEAGLALKTFDQHIISGGYPEIWDRRLIAEKWIGAYIQTYVERDVRQLKNIGDLGSFNRFVMFCATHAGQLVNREDFSRAIGKDSKTIQSWLSLLESSFIVFQLQPWFTNLNKRLIKSPKLYFYDTGLLCYLLGIHHKDGLKKHPHWGAIFENWIISEMVKNRRNAGIDRGLYFYRDSTGNEVDVLLEKQGRTIALEIKASRHPDPGMAEGLKFWLKHNPESEAILLYGGTEEVEWPAPITGISWKDIGNL